MDNGHLSNIRRQHDEIGTKRIKRARQMIAPPVLSASKNIWEVDAPNVRPQRLESSAPSSLQRNMIMQQFGDIGPQILDFVTQLRSNPNPGLEISRTEITMAGTLSAQGLSLSNHGAIVTQSLSSSFAGAKAVQQSVFKVAEMSDELSLSACSLVLTGGRAMPAMISTRASPKGSLNSTSKRKRTLDRTPSRPTPKSSPSRKQEAAPLTRQPRPRAGVQQAHSSRGEDSAGRAAGFIVISDSPEPSDASGPTAKSRGERTRSLSGTAAWDRSSNCTDTIPTMRSKPSVYQRSPAASPFKRLASHPYIKHLPTPPTSPSESEVEILPSHHSLLPDGPPQPQSMMIEVVITQTRIRARPLVGSRCTELPSTPRTASRSAARRTTPISKLGYPRIHRPCIQQKLATSSPTPIEKRPFNGLRTPISHVKLKGLSARQTSSPLNDTISTCGLDGGYCNKPFCLTCI